MQALAVAQEQLQVSQAVADMQRVQSLAVPRVSL